MLEYSLDYNELYPGLYIGSFPYLLEDSLYKSFDVAVFLAEELQPTKDDKFINIEIIKAPLRDCDPPQKDTFKIAERIALAVAQKIKEGKKVLVSCAAGRNRSGLVSALALRLLTGWPGDKCVEYVKSKRKAALTNVAFANYVSTLL